MKKKIIRAGVSLLGLGLLLFVTGCQTMEGFGRDIQGLGQRVEEWAR